jgi:hypothetical protein
MAVKSPEVSRVLLHGNNNNNNKYKYKTQLKIIYFIIFYGTTNLGFEMGLAMVNYYSIRR